MKCAKRTREDREGRKWSQHERSPEVGKFNQRIRISFCFLQARNQDFMWGGANEAKADPTTEMYFLSSDPFI